MLIAGLRHRSLLRKLVNDNVDFMLLVSSLSRLYLDNNHRKRKKFHERRCDPARLVILAINK